MANKTITISEAAYELLECRKSSADNSFTKVILRHLRPPADTCGELLERLEHAPAPNINRERMQTSLRQRGRRSPRR